MSERLKVRLAYQRGWQVVENNRVIETFDTKVEAFNFVHARGARVWLSWGRTVIGGQTTHYDFEASFGETGVGRVMKELHPPSAGTWTWSCYDGGARGRVSTRDEAVAGVEIAYTRRVVGADLPR
jgi:hypothetical protein